MPIIPITDIGSIGSIRDQFPPDIVNNAFSRTNNVRFRDGYAERMQGHQSIYAPPLSAPLYLQPLSTGTGRFWVYAGATTLNSVTNTTHANISRAVGGAYTNVANKLSGGVLGGIALINNQVDTPQSWGGTGLATNLANFPANTTCKVFRVFKNILMACNVTKSTGTNYPHMVKWSHPADPGAVPASWDETNASFDAGELDLADDQTRIVDALALGDVFMVYKEGAYYAMQYIGAPYIFRVQKISNMVGALTLNCAQEFPGGHVVMGQGDVITHQGGAPSSILDGRMRRWLFNNLDAQAYDKSFLATNFGRSEVWICFPQTGSSNCNTALIWNYQYNTLSVRDLPNIDHANNGVVDYIGSGDAWDSDPDSWDVDGTAWNQTDFTQSAQRLLMASSQNSKLYLVDSSTSYDGSIINVLIEREGYTFDDPASVKLLKSIRPIIDANAGTVINISVGSAMDQDAGTTWNSPQIFTVGTDQKLNCFTSGRYLAVRFQSTGTQPWRLRRMDFDVEIMGLY